MAAQIAAAGHGGQILVSDVAAALLERTDLVELGRYRLDTDVAAHPLMQLGPGAHPPLRADSRRGNLPLEPGRLIGRAQDLNRIATALQASPVVTLVGPGGIGKTRLALAAARMSDAADANRAWFVELAAISASADVPRTVAGVLDVKEPPGRTLTDAIVANLRLRPALLVLDNCEHVIEGAAILAHAIVEQCPQVSVLATSREGLRIPHEQLIAVAPLDPAGSGAELFDERASALSPTFDAGAHRADVEEICRRLDGIPLAIELAAARTPSLTPRDLLVRLSDRLRLLTRGHRTSAARHQTLRAAVQWSLDLLTPAQQLLFQQLSLFAGTFDAPAAAAVANTSPADAEDLLGDLVERSMLVVESGPFGQRFRYLETIREYAAGELRDRGDTDLIAGRHARWCLDQVTQIHQLLVGPGEVEGVARLAELWPNLRAAVDRACADRDGDLLDALVRPVVGEVNLRNQTEIGDWAERILSITPAADEDRTVFWLACATYRFKQSADHDGYERLVRGVGDPAHPLVRFTRAFLYDNGADLKRYSPAAVAWLRRRGEDHPAALAEIGGVAYPLMSTGQFAELDSFAAVLADRYRSQGPPTLLYVTLTMLGYSAFFQGDPERAERLFDEAARVDVPDGTVSVNKPIEARAAFRRGNQMRAFEILRAYIDELLAIDYPELAPNAAIEFINMMAAIDRPAAAAPVLSYLTASGDFGVLALRTVVADAAAQIAGARRSTNRHRTRVGSSGTCATRSATSPQVNKAARSYAGPGRHRHRGLPGGWPYQDDSHRDEPQAPGHVAGEVGEAGSAETEWDGDTAGDQGGGYVSEVADQLRHGAAHGDDHEDGEGGREGIPDGFAHDGPQPEVQPFEGVVCFGGEGGNLRVVADAGDQQHPPGQADDLDGGGAEADAGDPSAEGAAGDASEQDSDRREQRGADDECEKPAGDGGLVSEVGRQDVGRGRLEDLRVVEDRAEGGEAGDGESGGAGHGASGDAACGLLKHGMSISVRELVKPKGLLASWRGRRLRCGRGTTGASRRARRPAVWPGRRRWSGTCCRPPPSGR